MDWAKTTTRRDGVELVLGCDACHIGGLTVHQPSNNMESIFPVQSLSLLMWIWTKISSLYGSIMTSYDRYGIINNPQLTYLFNSLFRITPKNMSKLARHYWPFKGNISLDADGLFSQRVSDADSASMSWSHHACFCLVSLRWRHNEHDSVSNHQPHGCLLNRLFGCRSK